MTRDEVMAMTDEELWFEALMLARPELGIWRSLGIGHSEDGRAYIGPVGKPVEWQEDCDYPNGIAAAWPLLGKLYGRRGIACIETYMTDGECQVTLWTAMQNTVVLRQWKEGDRPEQAITRAFIIAMEENHG